MRNAAHSSRRISAARLLACAAATAGLLAVSDRAAAATKAYFIGNSITGYFDVPGLVGQIRSASGYPDDFADASHILFGKGLSDHWATPTAHDLLASDAWDYVVLQDFSLNPVDRPEQTRTYARLWDAEIKTVAPQAQTIFYAPWERLDRPGTQGHIDSVYFGLAAELGATVAPVGDAFARAESLRPELNLHLDNVHANLAGAYLSASVFYSTIFQQSPAGAAPPQGISADEALFLQNVAWDTVSGFVEKTWSPDVFRGTWDVAEHWNRPGVPASGQQVMLAWDDGNGRIIEYEQPAGSLVQLRSLTVDSRNGGYAVLFHSQDVLNVGDFYVGRTPGGSGNYTLGGTGALSAENLFVGYEGQGYALQTGGSMAVAGTLTVAARPGSFGSLHVEAGQLHAGAIAVESGGEMTQLGGEVRVAGNLRVSGGATYQFSGGTLRTGAITLAGGGALRLALGRALTLRTGSVSIDPQSTLDLADGLLAVDAGTLSEITALVASARNGPSLARWTGAGIGSFTAASDASGLTGLAVVPNDDGSGRPLREVLTGEPLGAGAVLVGYTFVGDMNLDGRVNIDDYFRIDRGLANQLTGYHNGDLDYSGAITADDFFLIDQSFLGQDGRFGAGGGQAGLAGGAGAVPEPAGTLMLPLLAGLATVRRRKRG